MSSLIIETVHILIVLWKERQWHKSRLDRVHSLRSLRLKDFGRQFIMRVKWWSIVIFVGDERLRWNIV